MNEELVFMERHGVLLRHLFAASSGLDERFLTAAEIESARQLEALSFVNRSIGGRLHANYGNRQLIELMRRMTGNVTAPIAAQPDTAGEQQTINTLLQFIQELTSVILRSNTPDDLFRAGFRHLRKTVMFDVGVSVLLEERLDLFVVRDEKRPDVYGDALVRRVKSIIDLEVPSWFRSTETVLRGEWPDLPHRAGSVNPLAQYTHTLLRQDSRTAGLFILFRSNDPFTSEEQQMLRILSGQVAMVLGMIQAREQIQSLADTDDLTGIANKRVFRQRLNAEIERARAYSVPTSMLLFDIDHFKSINDTHGHTVGDVVLSELCGAVKNGLRSADLFARIGGDEFAVLLPHTDLSQAVEAARRVCERVRKVELPNELKPTVSVGVATLQDEMSAAELFNAADAKLYEAKRSGRDRFSY